MVVPLLVLEYCLPQQWHTLLLVLLPLLFHLLARKGRRLHLPPGPPMLPILGNLHQMGALPHRSLRELARWHGPVMLLRLGAVPTVVVSSAEAAREVMKAHDADCCSRPDTPGARRLSYQHKDVAFAPYSDYWREMRKLFVVELLSLRRVQATWYAREAQVDKLIGRLTSAGRKPVSLEDHIFGLMDGVIGTVALGNIYGTEQFAQKKHFHDVIDEAMSAKASFSAEDYFPNAVGHLVDRLTGVVSRREKVFRDLDAFFDVIIDQHLDPSRAMPGNGPDLIDVMVGLMKGNQQGSLSFTRDHIKGLLSNVFTASVDTSSVTMVWAMAELMRKPASLKKVQEEVRAVVGNKERVQPHDMPKLKYLKMVVKETLRLHPAVPLLLPRETLRHVKISGYDVPAKTRLLVNAWAIGRDPSTWDNPEEFDPDRFEGKDVDFNGLHFELLPFGAGRRMCPGMAMGVATTEFTLANLLYCFDWELPEGMTPEDVSMEEAGGLTVHREMPLVLVPTRYNCQR
ncbi:4-hydroxyphenylacetaldehyde oxime monooxygenase-like [Phragmites australis]|uniref:4-hydroxyphenylacetaldehyde oxime monooxygenase-like n=1 Tax=Phragmites australis TaxID=29695 RepID=UPI002D776F74|nr:4-hydroxyphenylacetaldehyde oxime monooxygenase-like [Phragmites australis]